MPLGRVFKILNVLHRAMIVLTFGRRGWEVRGMPVIELTTVGRRSGRPHTVLLATPVRTDDALVLIASRGGEDQPPDWFLNLQARPEGLVADAGRTRQVMAARVATPDERDDLWPRVVEAYGGYANYQQRSSRVIPLVLLTARTDGTGEARPSP